VELIIFSVKIIHVVVSILLIIVVLLQPGKSGDLGSIFGGGTSESIFGSSGAVPFLAKVTRGLAVLFMLTSLSLGYFAASSVSKSVVKDVGAAPVEQTAPAETAPEGVTTEDAATTPQNAVENETAPADGGDAAMETPGDSTQTENAADKKEPAGGSGDSKQGETN
jgi:preprotein translocase subunit SecG